METCTDFSAWRALSAGLFPGTQLADAAPEKFHAAWSGWPMGDINFFEFFVSAQLAMTRPTC